MELVCELKQVFRRKFKKNLRTQSVFIKYKFRQYKNYKNEKYYESSGI